MKKILSFLLAIILIFSITACSSSSPKDSVVAYLDALKTNNLETMNKYITPDSEDFVGEIFQSEDDPVSEAFEKAFSKLEYKILSSKIDGNTAIVETEINAPNLGKIMTELIQEALPLAFASAFSEDSSEDNFDNLMGEMLLDKVISDDMPMVKKNVKINLNKIDDTWIMDINDEFLNAITGNLMQVSELFD